MCVVWEDCHKRSDGASMVGAHESRGIQKSKGKEWRCYGEQKMW